MVAMGGVLQPWTYENFWLDCRYSLGLWGRSPGKLVLFKNEYGSNSVFYLQNHQIFSRLDHPYIFHCWLPKSLTRPSQSDHKSLRLWTQHLQLLQSTNDLYLGSSVGTTTVETKPSFNILKIQTLQACQIASQEIQIEQFHNFAFVRRRSGNLLSPVQPLLLCHFWWLFNGSGWSCWRPMVCVDKRRIYVCWDLPNLEIES